MIIRGFNGLNVLNSALHQMYDRPRTRSTAAATRNVWGIRLAAATQSVCGWSASTTPIDRRTPQRGRAKLHGRVARKPAWRGRAALFGAGRRPMQEHSLVPMHGPGDAESETCGTGPDRPESGSAAGSWPIPALQRQLRGCKPSVDNKRERRRRPASKLRWVGRLPVASPPSVCPQPRPHPKEGQVARRRRSRGGHQRAEEAAGIRGPGARIRARGPHPKARRGEARPGGRSGGSGPSGFRPDLYIFVQISVQLYTDICTKMYIYLPKYAQISVQICTDTYYIALDPLARGAHHRFQGWQGRGVARVARRQNVATPPGGSRVAKNMTGSLF